MTPREMENWSCTATDAELQSIMEAVEAAHIRWFHTLYEGRHEAEEAAVAVQVIACIWPRSLDDALRPTGRKLAWRRFLVHVMPAVRRIKELTARRTRQCAPTE